MCSHYNRVIRSYNIPTLFLISVYGGEIGSYEFSVHPDINLPPNVKHMKEIEVPKTSTFAFIHEKVIEEAHGESTFEGFVIQTDTNKRVKAKNPYYLIQHILKYHGWIKASPERIVPLILDGMVDSIIHNVVDCMDEIHGPLLQKELTKRSELYKDIIQKEYIELTDYLFETDTYFNTNIESDSEPDYEPDFDPKAFIKIMTAHDETKFKRWFNICIKLYRSDSNLDSIWNSHVLKNITFLFPDKDPFLSSHHTPHICDKNIVLKEEDNDGISKNSETCHCGNLMKIERLRHDVIRYRTCHCGETYGFLTYNSGILLGVCTDPECMCTHEVNQTTGKALGSPASFYCKSLRLGIHELMNKSGFTKSQCYSKIQEITGRTKKTAHMAQMGIADCTKVLKVGFN